MRQLIPSNWQLGPTLAVLLPLGLWAMLWLSISPGNPAWLSLIHGPIAFIHGLRSLFPLVAAGAAAIVIGVKVFERSPRGFGLFSPLTLAVVYGLVGLVASINSPNANAALWWAALYLAVPIVLWGVVWSSDPLGQLRRLINATWLVIILAAVALFVVGALYLDLVDQFLSPSQFLECRLGGFFELTGGRLRGTGVGRYAAIAGIIAISGLCQGKWRPLWGLVLLMSVPLLFSTGARGAMGGFAVGASLVLSVYLVYAGKGAMLKALLALLIFVALVWSSGAHQTFVENCLFRSYAILTAPAPVAGVDGTPSPAPQPEFQVGPPAGQRAQITKAFFSFTGRTAIWDEGWRLFKDSPLIGFGFHADRLMLGTNMHNSVMQALLQAGLIGAIPLVAAGIFAWVLFFRIVRKLTHLSGSHKGLVIQCGGVLAFLTVRSFPESTGAFFGVDWLILALVMMYLHVVNYRCWPPEREGSQVATEERVHERSGT